MAQTYTQGYLMKHYDFLREHYSDNGAKWCAQKLDLPITKINYLRQRLNLKLSSKGKLKTVKGPNPVKAFAEYRVNPAQFINVLSPKVAYLLGLLWTDGHVYKNTNQIVFTCTKPDDKEYVPIFTNVGNWSIYSQVQRSNWKTRTTITTCNKPLKDLLVNLGFRGKESGLDKVYNHIPENLKSYFFMGLVDGDGCFYVKPEKSVYKFSLCSSHNQNWTCIEHLLLNLNIKYRIERTKSKSGSYSKIVITAIRRVSALGDFIYKKKLDFGLPRKYNKYLLTKKAESTTLSTIF